MQQRLALRQLHIQETPPVMAIIRTENGSEITISPDADFVIEGMELRLYNPNKPPFVLARAGDGEVLRELIRKLRVVLKDADMSDVVDMCELLSEPAV